MRKITNESLETIHTDSFSERKERGITLIALVVTIIILLILAGVTIGVVVNENGLFNKAKYATAKYNNEAERESIILGELENIIDSGGISGDRSTPTTENTMSTNEHFIGEYYFNGKPIYEKSIYVASLPNNKKEYYEHNIDDVEFIWFNSSKCIVLGSENPDETWPMPWGTTYLPDNTTKDNFCLNISGDRRNNAAIITLNYTKTTDSATITTTMPTTLSNKE